MHDDAPGPETARLTLSAWTLADADELAAICADPGVMRFFPAPLTRDQSDVLLQRLTDAIAGDGFGFWAVRERGSEELLGFVGLTRVPAKTRIDAAIEVGWRLKKSAWGRGIATEAAAASLDFGFANLGVAEIVAYTPAANTPSRRVMERLGMACDPGDDFDHESLPASPHPLQPHVVYRVTRRDWEARRTA